MKSLYKQVLLFSMVIVAMIVALHVTGITQYCTLDQIKQQSSYLLCLVERHYFLTVLIYLVTYTAFIAASIPAVGPLSIAGGFMFGFVPGLLYSLVGSLLGALIAFSVLKKMTARLHSAELTPRMAQLKARLDKYGHIYLLMLHFTIVVPFIVINTLAALANVSWSTFVWVTVVGMLPAAALYVFAGTQLATIEKIGDLFSWPVILTLLLVAALVIVPMIIARKKEIA